MTGLLCDAGVRTLADALALRPDLLAGYRALEAAVAAEPELDGRLRARCRARVATLCGGGSSSNENGQPTSDSDDVVLEFVEQLVFDAHGMTDDLVARLGTRLSPRGIVALAQAVVVWEGEHRLARTLGVTTEL